MTSTQDITAKFAVAAVAVAMIFSAFAPVAQAQTTEDLQQMINDLLAQVAELQSGLGGETTEGSTSAVCPYTWTRDLNVGSEGADVMKLQEFLNANADTRVAAAGSVGSAGMETMYYGPATGAAVSKFQVMHRAEVLTPAGLVNPTTYFGPSTRAKANMECVAAPMTEGEEGEEGSEEEEEEETDMTLGGEGTLVTFEVDDSEDEVTEGDEDVVVMALTLEAENGDVEVARLTFSLVADGTNEEEDAWDAFEEVSIWVDGDKIASFDASDEDEYLDEDAGTFRFSNLDLVLGEDDETEVLVAVSARNSVDGSDVDAAEWTIDVTEVRYFDADGVATTEDTLDELGDAGLVFDITEEGTDDGADLEGSSSNPDATTLLVDEDTDDSDEFVVHLFDIEVDNDSGDLEVGDVYATTTITNVTGSGTIGGQEDVVDGIFMTIDGETVEGEATTLGADDEDTTIADGGSTSVVYLFEFDQDVVLEGDENYEVEISMVFKGQDGEYVNGVTVATEVNGSEWEVEGSANDNELSGIDSSETHVLATVVPVITDTSFDVDRNEAGDAGTISFRFTMEADGENDVTFNFADTTDVDGSTDDLRFDISGGDLGLNATASIAKISGDATELGGNTGWTINDGDEAEFSLDVSFASASAAGAYRLYLDTISGVEIDETSTALNI
jgi:hypothetical protein